VIARPALATAGLLGTILGTACAVATAPVPPDAAAFCPRAVAAGLAAPTVGWTRSVPGLATALAEVSRTRELAVRKPVPGVLLSRVRLLERVHAHVAREVPAPAIRAEGLVQKLLGFVPIGADYEATLYRLLESQLAGYYEPADGTLYISDDLDPATTRSTLQHELTHALQDQHWDLGRASEYRPGQDDRSSALSMLAEGDATSAGADRLDESDVAFADRLRADFGSGGTDAPHAIRMALIEPYVTGALFVRALRREGGWRLVNETWATPPETTEQVLHLSKWRAREPALAVEEPPAPSADPSLVRIAANTYGELGLRLALAEWMSPATAAACAEGWGGDRAALFADRDRALALAWHVVFDDGSPGPSDALAVRAFRSLAQAFPARGVDAGSGTAVCVERSGNGVLAFDQTGRHLLLVVGETNTSGTGWRAQMTCAQARAWIDELRTVALPPG
jgi:hypothetical protein